MQNLILLKEKYFIQKRGDLRRKFSIFREMHIITDTGSAKNGLIHTKTISFGNLLFQNYKMMLINAG